MTYDVQRVVVGGGVSHAGSPFEAPLRRELAAASGRIGPRRRSCCRPTSSMSCHRKPKPAHGAPSPWRGPPYSGIGGGEPRLTPSQPIQPTKEPTTPRQTEGAPRRSDGHEDQAASGVAAGSDARHLGMRRHRLRQLHRSAAVCGPEHRRQRVRERPGRIGLAGTRWRPTRPRPSSRTSNRTPRSASGRSGCRRRSTPWIADTISRFEETYPGRQGQLGRSSGDVPGRPQELRSRPAMRPDVINLSVGEGWVSDYATRDLLLELDSRVPQEVKDIYFEGLWKSQNVDGKNYQFPFYQGVAVELINKRHFEAAGLDPAAFPTRGRGAAGAVPDPQGEGQRRLRHAADRQRPARADGLRGQRQGPVGRRQRASRSTRPRQSRGCRCTSTWSLPAPSTTPR